MTAVADRIARAEAARLERLARETGDGRFFDAAAVLTTVPPAPRADAIRALAAEVAADVASVRGRAEIVARVARRYEASAWPRHRRLFRVPVEIEEKPERHVWQVLRDHGQFPKLTLIRLILSGASN